MSTKRKDDPATATAAGKPAAKPGAPRKAAPARPEDAGFPIVGIGASAGGLEAFETFFKAMPPDSGVAFVLVPHLDPTHVSILPELLQKRTKMEVCQIRDGMLVHPDTVYVIPPNKDLSILNGVLQLMDLIQPRGANLPIDTFFRSLAQDQGANAVCVILSGTGTDGTLGLKAIKGEVGMVMVQDEESAKYDGMPRSAIATGLADYILPPEAMPEQLIKYTKHASDQVAPRIIPAQGEVPDALQKIFIILRARTSHDFSLYKKNTICRRIERRMNVHQIDDISDYVRYLRESEREGDILFKELLIGVTNFFRDPEAFEALKEKALLKRLRGKTDDTSVRAWVPGCSSGEEAYSVAMALHECMETLKRRFSVQIFGTDIDEDAIAVARTGLYPASILSDLGPERLKRYFTIEDDGRYRIKKAIREMLVFAPQNMIKDPPFTKLDLISCRNLLIYLDPELQRKLLPVFHYALGGDGILFLGSSETIGQATDLFAQVDNKWKIFRRKPAPSTHVMLELPAAPEIGAVPKSAISDTITKAEELSAFQMVEAILRQSDTPPCAIIDEDANVVYIHGRTGRFLEPAEGKVSVNIIEMARPGLQGELAAAIRKVGLNKQEVVSTDLRVQHDGEELSMDLTVRPVLEHPAMRGFIMVVFQEVATPKKAPRRKARPAATKKRKTVDEIEEELRYTRESLQTTIEELETSNEELKSTNEELQSTNEELQSTNEEMETSKEELQSLNEEAATVNAELQSRIEDLSKANDDMKNLLDSTEIATIFLDTELCISRFTPRATEIIPLAGTDSGRPIKHFASNLVNVDFVDWAEKVMEDLSMRKTEVQHADGRSFLMRIRPYRTTTNVIDGVVITFEDITRFKRIENSLRESERNMRLILENSPDYVIITDRAGMIQYLNRAPRGSELNAVVGTAIYDYQPPDDAQRPVLREALEQVFQTGEATLLESRAPSHEGTVALFETRITPILEEQHVVAAMLISTNLTEREKIVEAVKKAVEESSSGETA